MALSPNLAITWSEKRRSKPSPTHHGWDLQIDLELHVLYNVLNIQPAQDRGNSEMQAKSSFSLYFPMVFLWYSQQLRPQWARGWPAPIDPSLAPGPVPGVSQLGWWLDRSGIMGRWLWNQNIWHIYIYIHSTCVYDIWIYIYIYYIYTVYNGYPSSTSMCINL